MKINLNEQLFAGTNNKRTEQGYVPALKNEFYSTFPNEVNQPMELQNIFNVLNTIKNAVVTLPATETATVHSAYPVKKANADEAAANPILNKFLRQVSVRLSDIEFAIDNNDLPRLEFAVLVLKDLFLDMKLPSAYRLILQMEELANENKLKEADEILLAIKKIIAKVVGNMQPSKD